MIQGRYLAGHYDSTKQKNAFLKDRSDLDIIYNIDDFNDDYYKKIKIRLMIDMLFNETIVLPYSQYLDGYFFHLLFRNNSRDNFLEALKIDSQRFNESSPFFEIRISPDDTDIEATFIDKLIQNDNFLFSSLEAVATDLSIEFHKNLSTYLSRGKNDLNSLLKDKYILTDYDSEYKKKSIELWLNEFDNMLKIPSKFIKKWDKNKNFIQGLNIVKNSWDIKFPAFKEYLKKLIENAKKEKNENQINLLNEILQQLDDNNVQPDRSDIFSKLSKSELNDKDKNEIMKLYNNLYNSALSWQHDCFLCDEGINKKVTVKEEDIIDYLSLKTRKTLAGYKWPDFFNLLRDKEIQYLKRKLWSSDDDRKYKKNAKKLYQNFIDKLNPQETNEILRKKIFNLVAPFLMTEMVEIIIIILNSNRIDIYNIIYTLLINSVNIALYKNEDIKELTHKIIEAHKITNYITNNFYGGGSDYFNTYATSLIYSDNSNEKKTIMALPCSDKELDQELPNNIIIGINQ